VGCIALQKITAISLSVKNFENRSAFDTVRGKNIVALFFRTRCTVETYMNIRM